VGANNDLSSVPNIHRVVAKNLATLSTIPIHKLIRQSDAPRPMWIHVTVLPPEAIMVISREVATTTRRMVLFPPRITVPTRSTITWIIRTMPVKIISPRGKLNACWPRGIDSVSLAGIRIIREFNQAATTTKSRRLPADHQNKDDQYRSRFLHLFVPHTHAHTI